MRNNHFAIYENNFIEPMGVIVRRWDNCKTNDALNRSKSLMIKKQNA